MITHYIKTHSFNYKKNLIILFMMIAIFGLIPKIANAALVLSPASLNYENVAVNADKTLTITVTNTDIQGPYYSNIVATIASGAFTQTNTCSGVVLEYGDSCSIQVTFSPLATGVASDSVGITAREWGDNLVFDSVPLFGTGVKGGLEALPTLLDFGSIPVSSSSTQQVTISNPGNGDISLGSISISGEFAQTNTCGPTLTAGANCLIDITYNPLTAGNVSGSLNISALDTDGVTPLDASVSLVGTGTKGGLEVSPSLLDFGSIPVSSSSIRQVTISNPGNGEISFESISISGEFSQTNTCGPTLTAGANCLIDITYNPLTAGNVSGSLNISALDTDGVTPLDASVSLVGTGTKGGLEASPSVLDFGSIPVSSSSTRQVTISNPGNGEISFESISISGEFSQTNTCGPTLTTGANCLIDVTYKPLISGDVTGSLNISAIDTDGVTPLSTTVSLSGDASIDQEYLEELLLSYAGDNPSVRSTTIVISEVCTSGQAGNNLQEDCNVLIQAAESGDAGTTGALLEITPERAIKASGVIQQGALAQLSNSTSRIVALHNGASGFSVAGLALNINEQTFTGDHLLSLINAGDTGGAAGSEGSLLGAKWGGFITGTIVSGDKDATSLESGLDFNTKGIMLGIDYRFNDQFVLGGALGYMKTDTDLDNDGGDLDSNGYSLTAYGTYYDEQNYYIDFSVTYGVNDFDQKRHMSYQFQNQGSANQFAKADYDSDMLTLFVAGGYNFNYGSWMLGPRLSLEYIDINIDDFTEKMSDPNGSGAGWGTNIDDTDQQWLTLKLGGKISYAYSTSWGVLTPYSSIDWLHEFKGESQVINGSFVEDPANTSFSLYTESPDKNYFQFTVGVSAVLPGGMIGYLNYDTILSNDLWSKDSINAGIRLEF